jgi:hypothetical protein
MPNVPIPKTTGFSLLGRGFNFDRYERELRRPFPRNPQFAPGTASIERTAVSDRPSKYQLSAMCGPFTPVIAH